MRENEQYGQLPPSDGKFGPDLNRRQFLKNLAIGSAALATGLEMANPQKVLAGECTYSDLRILFENPAEMRFQDYLIGYSLLSPKYKKNGTDVIIMDGTIEIGSSMKFTEFLKDRPNYGPGSTVYLNSTGGNLKEGLELGKIIREKKFNTAIGNVRHEFLEHLKNEGPEPASGACLSACTFAFLGGVERRMSPYDIFGPHRFYNHEDTGMDKAQQSVGVLLEYVRSMGVSQQLVEEMTKAPPNKFNRLDPLQLRELNVITSTKWLTGPKDNRLDCR